VAPLRFGSGVQGVFVMQVLPGRRYPDLIVEDANLPENAFAPPDETPLDVSHSPRAHGWATNDRLPESWARVRFRFSSPAGLEPTAALRASVRRQGSWLIRGCFGRPDRSE
jgi:hypothetical protein